VWSEIDPLPPNLPVVHIGLLDWEMGKNFPVELAVRADLNETLLALTPLITEVGGERLARRAQTRLSELARENWSAKRERLSRRLQSGAKATPIDYDWLTLQLAEALPANAVVVNEGLTSARHLTDLVPYRDRYGFHALASGGIGWGLPAAVGVALAQAPRPVACYSGDGSAMYSIQALWTAAHHKLPITFLIANNGGYRIIKQRLLSFHGNDHYIGMDFADPAIDFAALAKSLGMPAERITDPQAVPGALRRAFSTPGPKLLDVVVEGRV
jgi:benzoylformate decarboxylase